MGRVIVTLVLLASVPMTAAAQRSALTALECGLTLQAQVDAAPSGSTLVPAPCVYREKVFIGKPLVLDGQGRAEIRGSDVWTTWTQVGSTWLSQASVPPFRTDGSSAQYTDQFAAQNREQVFMDGVALKHVAAAPGPMQFALDGARRVIVGSNPNGHLLEVTTRDRWLVTGSDNVVIAAMVLKHAATGAEDYAIGSENHNGFVLRDSLISDTHGSAVSPSGSGTQILRNAIARSGSVAVTTYQDRNTLIRSNAISDNSYGGWDWGWMGGGMKFVASSGLTVDANTVVNNDGPGIWCDIGCSMVTMSNNVVHDNAGPNVFYEISTNAKIDGNRIWNQAGDFWPALYVASSGSVEVSDNVVAWSGRGMQAYAQARPDAPQGAGSNIFFHDNTVLMAKDGFAAFWSDSGTGVISNPSSDNRGTLEGYWYPGLENGVPRFQWGSSSLTSLSTFIQTPAGQQARYLSAAEAQAVIASAGMPYGPLAGNTTPTPSYTPTVAPTSTRTPTRTPTPTRTASVCTPNSFRNGAPDRFVPLCPPRQPR